MRLSFATFVVAILVCLAMPAEGHHSFAASYDGNKPVTIRGKISKLGWLNPHTHIYVDVVNQKGETATWEVETASTIALSRAGMRREDFVGQAVIVTGFLARDGTPTMTASKLTLVDKNRVFSSDEASPAAR